MLWKEKKGELAKILAMKLKFFNLFMKKMTI